MGGFAKNFTVKNFDDTAIVGTWIRVKKCTLEWEADWLKSGSLIIDGWATEAAAGDADKLAMVEQSYPIGNSEKLYDGGQVKKFDYDDLKGKSLVQIEAWLASAGKKVWFGGGSVDFGA